MTSVARIFPYLLVFTAAGCADKLPLDNSDCPCPASLGYVCCNMGGVRSRVLDVEAMIHELLQKPHRTLAAAAAPLPSARTRAAPNM
jgi:hypothetical protein